MLQADVLRVLKYDGNGRFASVHMYGRDGNGAAGTVNVSGFAARLMVEALQAAGERGRARSGLEEVLRAAGFSDPGRNFAFALDYLSRERREGRSTVAIGGFGNGRGGEVYRLCEQRACAFCEDRSRVELPERLDAAGWTTVGEGEAKQDRCAVCTWMEAGAPAVGAVA